MKKLSILLFIISVFAFNSFAQKKDKVKIQVDTSYAKHRANRAALFSAVLPGAGQVYNKKYWKVPILYAGIVGLVVGIEFNDRYYKSFRKAYQYRVDADSTTIDTEYQDKYPDASSLVLRRDYYRRTRDLLYIIGGVAYVLNIIDAYVDAHLANFDINDDLSFKAEPGIQFLSGSEPVASVKISFNFH